MTDSIERPRRGNEPDGSEAEIGRLCFLISKDLRTALDRSLAEFELRAQQAAVLLHCCRQRNANPGQLASDVGTDSAGITGLLDQLEKQDLVIRRENPSDRRGTIVEPTGKGRDLLPRISKVFRTASAHLITGLSNEEASRLREMLERVRQNAAKALKK